MRKFRQGDIVARISYNKDVLFEITQIIKTSNNNEIMILKGITERIEADSPSEDLEKVDKRIINEEIHMLEQKITKRIALYLDKPKYCFSTLKRRLGFLKGENRSVKRVNTGKILHLDGDKRYSEKSSRYYKNLGLNAIVRNIPENKQPQVIRMLLDRYNPDVLVITGHDRNDKKRNRLQ